MNHHINVDAIWALVSNHSVLRGGVRTVTTAMNIFLLQWADIDHVEDVSSQQQKPRRSQEEQAESATAAAGQRAVASAGGVRISKRNLVVDGDANVSKVEPGSTRESCSCTQIGWMWLRMSASFAESSMRTVEVTRRTSSSTP